jgi:putative endonuclease
MVHGGCVYILVNVHHTVFYVGVTSDLFSRVTEHKEKIHPFSFTAKYHVSKLVYYETFYSIEEAIEREKQIKKYSRVRKVALIVNFNPEWRDMYEDIKYW